MTYIHIHAPNPIQTVWDKPTKDYLVKTSCCRDKGAAKQFKRKIQFYEWYGPTITFWCEGSCNEKTKRDGRRRATVWYCD